ncbi:MAG: hypothetical protein ABIE70_06135 [bacterium]
MSATAMQAPQTFHIPVMGTGFTIDTPIRVAKYGIGSVMSIGDDMLIEKVRRYYAKLYGRPTAPIKRSEPDARARRIEGYLNLVGDIVKEEFERLRNSVFEAGSEITKYFEMLPQGSLKQAFVEMLATENVADREGRQSSLRDAICPGRIEANIMTKIDRDYCVDGVKTAPEQGVAMSALRGFARSKLRAGLVLSAGINRRLFAYLAEFEGFFPTNQEPPQKEIILKVSDYRSAELQGRLLAKRGLWVQEFRVESGLNCGGHAFATMGELMGPILEEFNTRRQALQENLRDLCLKALALRGIESPVLPNIRITAQGGVGTNEEHQFLLDRYQLDSIGWGTPFLLVPEATSVDSGQLKKLVAAGEKDISLSNNSPLGVPFWSLANSDSEIERRRRIDDGQPGSGCPKEYLAMDFEFGQEPLCKASRTYQKQKLQQVAASNASADVKRAQAAEITARTCLCSDLAAGTLIRLGLTGGEFPCVCTGPNMVNFDRIVSLSEMVDHIYGRQDILKPNDRPHMFAKELALYLDYLSELDRKTELGLIQFPQKYRDQFISGLVSGIAYYRKLAAEMSPRMGSAFGPELKRLEQELTCRIGDSASAERDCMTETISS